MSFAFIASVSKQGTIDDTGNSSAINTTGADLLVAIVVDYSAATAATFTDSAGNTWSTAFSPIVNGSSSRTRIMYCQGSINTSATHTFRLQGVGTAPAISVAAFSGSASSPLDQGNSATTGSGSSLASGSITPAQNDELVIFAATDSWLGSLGSSVGTVSTSQPLASGSAFASSLGYSIQTTATAVNPNLTFSSSTNVTALVVSFKSVAGPTTTTIAPNNAGIVYSPYNWDVNSSRALTPNPGAYFKTMFTGSATCALTFDVSIMSSPTAQFWWRIDYGTWTKATASSSVTLTIPSDTLSNADIPYHMLEVIFKSLTETGDCWLNSSNSGILKLTGIVLDNGGSVSAPVKAPYNILVYGDSITEGYRTVGESASNDTDRNDGQQSWAYLLGKNLGAEVGVVGFGGQGYALAGGGDVPALTSTYGAIINGVSRSFSPAPDLIVINHGINDAANSVNLTTFGNAIQTVVNGLLAAATACPIICLEALPNTYSGWSTYWTAVQSAVNTISSSRVHAIGAGTIFTLSFGADSASVHPAGPNNQGKISPQIAALLYPYLLKAPVGRVQKLGMGAPY